MDGHGFCIARATRPSNPAPLLATESYLRGDGERHRSCDRRDQNRSLVRSSKIEGHSRFGLMLGQVRLLKHTSLAASSGTFWIEVNIGFPCLVSTLDGADVATFLVDDVHRLDTVLARTLSEEIGAGLEARFADRGQTWREQSSRLVRLKPR